MIFIKTIRRAKRNKFEFDGGKAYATSKVTGVAFETAFYIPWPSVVIAVGSVFIVVFATMLYATGKIKNDNPIDALKNENI